jgi:hypothetical protein
MIGLFIKSGRGWLWELLTWLALIEVAKLFN